MDHNAGVDMQNSWSLIVILFSCRVTQAVPSSAMGNCKESCPGVPKYVHNQIDLVSMSTSANMWIGFKKLSATIDELMAQEILNELWEGWG